jgi:hypothetical protein
MKNFIRGFFFTIILFTGGVITSSCDPCSGVVCTDGNCSNGTCVCNSGYKKFDNKCIPISLDYTEEDWHGTQIHSFRLAPADTQSVVYTFEPSKISPNQIVLKGFLGYIQYDLPFSINLDQRNTFVEELILPVDITNGTLTNPPFLPVPFNVAGTIKTNKINITLTMIDSLESYKLILQR